MAKKQELTGKNESLLNKNIEKGLEEVIEKGSARDIIWGVLDAILLNWNNEELVSY